MWIVIFVAFILWSKPNHWAIKMHFGNYLNENAASLLTIRTQTNEQPNEKLAYVLQTATR